MRRKRLQFGGNPIRYEVSDQRAGRNEHKAEIQAKGVKNQSRLNKCFWFYIIFFEKLFDFLLQIL